MSSYYSILSIFLIFSMHWSIAGLENKLLHPTQLVDQLDQEIQLKLKDKRFRSNKTWSRIKQAKIPDPKTTDIIATLRTNESYQKHIEELQDIRFQKGITSPLSGLTDFFGKHLEEDPKTLISPLFDKLREGLQTEPKTKAEKESLSLDEAFKEIHINTRVRDMKWSALENIQNQLEIIRRNMSTEDDLTALKEHLTTKQYDEYQSIMIDKKSKQPMGIFETIAHIYSTMLLPIESFRQLCLDNNGKCYKGFENTHNAIIDIVKTIPLTNE